MAEGLGGLLAFLSVAGAAAAGGAGEASAAVVTIEDTYTLPAWGLLMRLLRDAVAPGAARGAPPFRRVVVVCANRCREDCVASLERANVALPREGGGAGEGPALRFIDVGESVLLGADGEAVADVASYSARAGREAQGPRNAYAESLMGALRDAADARGAAGGDTLYLVDSVNAISLGVDSRAHFLDFLDALIGRGGSRGGVVLVAHKDVDRDLGLLRHVEDVSDVVVDLSPLRGGPAEDADGTLRVTCRTTRAGSILRRDGVHGRTLTARMLFKQREAGGVEVVSLPGE